MNKLRSKYVLITSLLILGSCSRDNKDALVNKAQQQTEKYYEYIKKDSIDAALTLFDPKFFEVTSKDKFRNMLLDIRQRVGTIQKSELLKTVQTYELSKGTTSENVVVTYKVTYNSGYVASQDFEFSAGDKVFELIDHWSFKEFHP